MTNGAPAVKSEPKSFDPHDNDAANGLFMLAQGAQQRNGAPNGNQFTATTAAPVNPHTATVNPHVSPQMSSINGGSVGSVRGASEGSNMSEESEPKMNTRGKGKRTNSAANGRKKMDDAPVKQPPAKKAKSNGGGSINGGNFDYPSDVDDDMMKDEDGPRGKMTDEEKRKNFLERNRYVYSCLASWIRANHCLVWPLSSVVNARSNGWRTCKQRWRCSALRTTPSPRRLRNCERRSSASRLSYLHTRTAL